MSITSLIILVAMDTTYLLCFSCSLLLKLEQERFKAFLKWTTRMIQSVSEVDISDIMILLPMDHSMNSRLLGLATWYCQHHQYNTTVISIDLRSQVSIAAPPTSDLSCSLGGKMRRKYFACDILGTGGSGVLVG